MRAAGTEPSPGFAGDPTQRLLTTLGRFHRYVAKGQAGAPQEFWSDDCMNQLLAGVELAVDQGWKGITEALTGTARVLQTYETSSAAHLCVPFLNDSYEILCLLVGDLIVNNTHSAVMDNWRERYNRAVTELTAAGLVLVDDEPGDEVEDEQAAPAALEPVAAAQESDPEPEDAPAETEEAAPFELPDEEPAASEESEAPSLDDFLFGEAARPAVAQPQPAPLFQQAVPAEAEPAEADPQPQKPAAAAAAEVANMLDALCDDLARLEQSPQTYSERVAVISYRVESLQSYAGEKGLDVSADLSGRMLRVCRLSAGVKSLDEAFLDLAYAFCDAYVQAFDNPEAASIEAWLEESMRVMTRLELAAQQDEAVVDAPEPMDDPAEKPAVEETDEELVLVSPDEPVDDLFSTFDEQAPEPPAIEAIAVEDEPVFQEQPQAEPEPVTAVVEPAPAPAAKAADDGSPEALLEIAQRAIAQGDMPSAKILALQAVAQLARSETTKAESRVREAEIQFQQNAEQIENARQQVKKVEQEVVLAENRVAEAGVELADSRAHSSRVEEKVAGIEQRVAEIDEQIRQLQAARDAEMQRVEATRRELEEAQKQENDAQAVVDGLRNAELAARARLEESRQSVKDLQRNRLEYEEMLSRARETLTHHRSSMADIERTIGQLRPETPHSDESGEELLF